MSGSVAGVDGSPPLVLIVEDEPHMRRFLWTTLECRGYRVAEAATGNECLVQASARNPELILLDLGLPDQDGLEVTKRLREWTATPIIVLSARGQEEDKVKALDAGADDYLTKPFGVGELLARMRVALRHARSAGGVPEPMFEEGDVRVDLAGREVFARGAKVHLTPIEYRLLTTLIQHAGKVMTHRQLLEQVWGPTHVNEAHYLRVYMAQLRRKLEANPARPRILLTEPSVGYRLKVD